MGCLFALIIYFVIAAISWLFCVGITALICACFGFAWSIAIGTGVWLIMVLLLFILGNGK